MLDFIIILLCAYSLAYAENKMVSYFQGATGYIGSSAVAKGEYCFYPGKYRVLTPWIIYFIGRINVLKNKSTYPSTILLQNCRMIVHPGTQFNWISYSLLKFSLILGALISMYVYLHTFTSIPILGVLLFAILLPITFLFDYAECWTELILLGFFMVGALSGWSIIILCSLTLLAALNRETTVLYPAIYWIYTNNLLFSILIFIIFILGQLIPRVIYGFSSKKTVTSFRFKDNVRIIKQLFCGYHDKQGTFIKNIVYNNFNSTVIYMSLLIAVFLIGWPTMSIINCQLYLLFIIFAGAISIPGSWSETRIYYPTLFVIVPTLTKLLTK